MNPIERRIAFKVEFSRILELLADQIYQSPLALLRENTQNAFDAVRMREAIQTDRFEPRIEVTVSDEAVTVVDNGIGMTAEEVETHFWYAGKSGKNTDAARAAGVVGTFGIGALANFGVAEELSVETESAVTGERTLSSVRKTDLSTDTEGISVTPAERTGTPGTVVRARLSSQSGVSVHDARQYLKDFVEFVDIPVLFNGEILSGSTHREVLPSERHAWMERLADVSVAGILSGDIEVIGMASGELRVVVQNIRTATGLGRPGAIVLLQDLNALRTLRSGFGLATVGMQSLYGWGGVVDLPFLTPTAGREALDASSNQLLQQLLAAIDSLISPVAAGHPEALSNEHVLQWIAATRRYELCGPLEVSFRPGGDPETLETVVQRSGLRYYGGRDSSVIAAYASEDEPLVVLSRRSQRRDCEQGYLAMQGIREVDIAPKVKAELAPGEQSFAHSALATRVTRVLEEDYFLPAEIRFGSISGELPILVTDTGTPVVIFLDSDSTTIAPLLALYRDDYTAFGPFVKDFVRSAVFPRISKLVPSSTREGAEAFLRHLRSNREWFEYELDDKAELEEILEELRAGRLTLAEATRQLVDSSRSVVEVSPGGAVPLSSVVGGVEDQTEDDALPDPLASRPAIDRRDEETTALILTSEEADLNGYTCFLSLSSRVQREKGDFFLQPHATEIVWGGRKVVFVFQHHSGRFGLYYDILCPGLVAETAGGGPRVTSTILTKDRTFIPIPSDIAAAFLPKAGEVTRLEVRCDILYIDEIEVPD
ncbi:MAG: ATP-binding protein [Acidimicrobiaceae bacterium]|nr:ATP-binding protein [Acidimicrobiaceae bacterium]MXZ64827.1 ATP-binding protein [Acidimicrobiaceae bacterium]MYF32282.1 ATP-binding protein [Acidimicrobiaceae bacterium]MYG77744.1 ATP-binding protein [Acidimicrobiaceae bacterium]MYJ84052.1 ATP-binding protein [Acidimicrobiaceae bacterium]